MRRWTTTCSVSSAALRGEKERFSLGLSARLRQGAAFSMLQAEVIQKQNAVIVVLTKGQPDTEKVKESAHD
jgi:hypothetical protein